MISSTSFSHSRLLIAFLGLILCAGCARVREGAPKGEVTGGRIHRIALLPVENLSGGKAPLKELRQAFREKLRAAGAEIVPDEALNQFMARHRLRYIGGIDNATARAFKEEVGADAVLVTSLELYGAGYPPRIALTARLVSAAENAEILWMESIGMAGDDSPGVFELGVVRDMPTLMDKALGRLSDSLSGYLADSVVKGGGKPSGIKFPPKKFFRADLDPNKKYRVAVIPFSNRSDRKNAAEIMVLHFVRELGKIGNFHVIEPGVVRHGLLQYRVIMEEGVSLANADVIFSVLRADLLLTGKVTEYQDAQGGTPKVGFSTMLLERESRMVVEASEGDSSGDDHVVFFDFGRVSTAHGVAAGMARGIAERIAGPPAAPEAEGK